MRTDGALPRPCTEPHWPARLATAAAGLRAEDVSPFLVPTGVEARRSAVLILLTDTEPTGDPSGGVSTGGVPSGGVSTGGVPSGGPSVLLLERASTLRQHAGQIAFPGGASDPGDADATATALREAAEEVGLDPGSVEVLAVWPQLHLSITAFAVIPVLARWHAPHRVTAVDPGEVARVALVAVGALADPVNRFSVTLREGFTGPGFAVDGLFVWGFTAGLLDTLLRVGGWERPWDRALRRPVPAALRTAASPAIGDR
ncbi:MAG: CoA pyrophosphatase [Actinomycetota bacterium]|nr:CoA pyrophosphatase [Actinomycetota bacterium]